jgi:3-oxoacyl-[acyl-carrier protein] reductase
MAEPVTPAPVAAGDRVMLITGTRTGIGRQLAAHYLAAGWRVAGCSRGPTDLRDPRYAHYTVDVADEPAVTAMVRQIARDWGRIDALLNNAGIAAMNAALLTPGSTLQRIFATNTFGSFYCARECAKVMVRQQAGRIVFFSTVAAPLNLEGELAYAASKAAVESMTRVLARELGPHGVTVNAVGPTPIDTDLVRGVPADKMAALLARQAIARMGTVDDVIHGLDFLVDARAAFYTGQVLYLGGVSG